MVGEDVEEVVGALDYHADSSSDVDAFLFYYFVVFELDAAYVSGDEAAGEEVAFPVGEFVAGVEGEAGGGGYGCPDDEGVDHAGEAGVGCYEFVGGVVSAEAGFRPAVVFAGFGEV